MKRLILLAWAGMLLSIPAVKAVETRTVRCRVSAYCPCEICTDGDGITSTGDDAYVIDGVAADPKRLPYRTRLAIPGVGEREVDDTGAAMKRGETLRIDLRFALHSEAVEWGVRYLDVEILE